MSLYRPAPFLPSYTAPGPRFVPSKVSAGAETGTFAATDDADVLAGSGIAFTAITGTSAPTEADDALASSGIASTALTATSAVTEGNDALASTGVFAHGILGTFARTEANDTLASAGRLPLHGTVSISEAGDGVFALAWDVEPTATGYEIGVGTSTGVYGTVINVGNVLIYILTLTPPGTYYINIRAYNGSGSGAWDTEIVKVVGDALKLDTLAAAGSLTEHGTFARTDAADTLAASGSAFTAVTGTLAYTEANDATAFAGTAITDIQGSLAYTDANDTLISAGVGLSSGSFARTDANDTLASSGTAMTAIAGTVAYTEVDDTLTASGSSVTGVAGPLVGVELLDVLVSSGGVITPISGVFTVSETADVLFALGIAPELPLPDQVVLPTVKYVEPLEEFFDADADLSTAASYQNSLTIYGIFEDPSETMLAMAGRRPVFRCQASDIPLPARGQTLGIGAANYKLAGWTYDGTASVIALELEFQGIDFILDQSYLDSRDLIG